MAERQRKSLGIIYPVLLEFSPNILLFFLENMISGPLGSFPIFKEATLNIF